MAWQEIIADTNVWVHEYSVPGYSQVNAFAVLLDDHNLAIISPPTQMSEVDFAAIDDKGCVTALIAPHSGHDLISRYCYSVLWLRIALTNNRFQIICMM
jgi:hypothetical protein